MVDRINPILPRNPDIFPVARVERPRVDERDAEQRREEREEDEREREHEHAAARARRIAAARQAEDILDLADAPASLPASGADARALPARTPRADGDDGHPRVDLLA